VVRLELQESQVLTLRHALFVAAERYDEDASTLRELKPHLEQQEREAPDAFRLIHSSACDHMAEQFDIQARQTRELIELIDELDGDTGPWSIERKED
jgi:hypothetical protein